MKACDSTNTRITEITLIMDIDPIADQCEKIGMHAENSTLSDLAKQVLELCGVVRDLHLDLKETRRELENHLAHQPTLPQSYPN